MQRHSVKSSNIKAVGHDATHNVMEVEFLNGRIHHYPGVTADQHKALLKAHSIGRHFAANHRNNKNKPGEFDPAKAGD